MKFRIEQYELWVQSYTVEAKSKAEAIKKVIDGVAVPDDLGLEYIRTLENKGMSDDLLTDEEYEELINCDNHDDYLYDSIVPSIRSVEEINPTKQSKG